MKWHLVVAVTAFSLSLVGQEPGSQGEPAPPKEKSRAAVRAQSMREQIDAGKPVQIHVRVAVRLKNGNRLQGVVKDGKLVERVDGLRFVDAQATERGAGIRLWYSSGAHNYVFVPFADFAEYQVLQQLSPKQLAELENEIRSKERREAELAAQAAAKAAAAAPAGETVAAEQAPTKPAAPPAPGKTPDKEAKPAPTGAEQAKAELEQQRTWVALLQEYPPAAGWNKERRDEIARRFVVVGAKPSASEQKFVDSFEEWLKACDHFGIQPTKPAAEEGDGKGSRKSRRQQD